MGQSPVVSTHSSTNSQNVLSAWQVALGNDRVVTAPAALERASWATFSTTQQVCCILQPQTKQQVRDCVAIAQAHNVPLYPISSGKNWGYGSRVPVQGGCALLDLSGLDRIVEFNEELAYVTLEPGVTQRQLYQFLQARSSKLWMDVTGSSPDSSLIGNIVERGFGHTPYGDRFAHVCGLEVVLPNGDYLHTGFGQFPNARAAAVYRWGVGPHLDGLFSQSNLGIVTQMTFWLMPAPESFQAFFFSLKDMQQLPAAIDALRPLRLNGTIRSAVHIGNGYKVLSSFQQFPYPATQDRTPLTAEALEPFARAWDFGAWNGFGGLYGSKQQVAEARRLVTKALRGRVSRLRFVDDRTIALGERLAKPYRAITGFDVAALLKSVRPIFNLMKGVPTASQLGSAYWRKRSPKPEDMDPDRDRCGLMWCAPVVPLLGREAETASQLTTEILLRHGFEPAISMTLLTGRCLGFVIAISYDRDVAGEDERAMACHRELSDRLAAEGYYPYRLGIQSMDVMAQGEASYRQFLATVKQAIDPGNIFAPGRYLPAPPDGR